MIRKILVLILAISLTLELVGCGPLKRKFTRKKKKPKPPPVYYELEKYTREPNVILYKRHYIYWKTWQEELINKIDEGNYKKNLRCAEEIINNLEDMKKFLIKEKADQLQPYIDEMEKIKGELSKKFITFARVNRTRSTLERRYRKIKREFFYKKIKDYILPDVTPSEDTESEDYIK